MAEHTRTRIFMPIEEIERSIDELTSTEAREAKIAHMREGIRGNQSVLGRSELEVPVSAPILGAKSVSSTLANTVVSRCVVH